jgi:hypothetical protein
MESLLILMRVSFPLRLTGTDFGLLLILCKCEGKGEENDSVRNLQMDSRQLPLLSHSWKWLEGIVLEFMFD